MGGGGITIDLEVIRADDVLAPAEFHRRLWRWIRIDIGNRLRRAANQQVLRR